MRVSLGTDVLASAIISRGLCHDVVRIVLEEDDLVVSRLVVEGFTAVLRDNRGALPPSLAKALHLLDYAEVTADPRITADLGNLQSGDASILAAAIEADALVTGDLELVEAAEGSAIPALAPRRLMGILRHGAPYPEAPDADSQVSEARAIPVREMTFQFALYIVELYRALRNRKEHIISKQLLRSGASIGAMVEEASAAERRGTSSAR